MPSLPHTPFSSTRFPVRIRAPSLLFGRVQQNVPFVLIEWLIFVGSTQAHRWSEISQWLAKLTGTRRMKRGHLAQKRIGTPAGRRECIRYKAEGGILSFCVARFIKDLWEPLSRGILPLALVCHSSPERPIHHPPWQPHSFRSRH